MTFAASGFAYPSILLQPTGHFLDVRARRIPRQYSSVEFLVEGSRSILLAEAQTQLSDLVTTVIERLNSAGIKGTPAQTDWQAIGELRVDEQAFSRAAGSFGFDPFDTPEDDALAISDLVDRTGPNLREDLFSLAPPSEATEVLESIHDICEQIDKVKPNPIWTTLSGQVPDLPNDLTPWQSGYEVARWVRGQQGLDGQPIAFEGDLTVPTMDLSIDRDRLAGVVASASPACALKPRPDASRRFAVARSIGDFLTRSVAGPTLLTTMKTERQARSRCFAAELLAPETGIRHRLGGPSDWIDSETVDELADEFKVSSFVIMHQIENHGIGRVGA